MKQTRGDWHLPSFAFRLEQSKDVLHTHRTLDVADDRAGAIVHKLDTDLRDASSRSSAAENLSIPQKKNVLLALRIALRSFDGTNMNLGHFCELDGNFRRRRILQDNRLSQRR